jgi:hypothetical protein
MTYHTPPTLATAITNLRNRIEASKKAITYSERTHVDVPVHELEAMLNERDRLREALESATKMLEDIGHALPMNPVHILLAAERLRKVLAS